MQSRILVLLGLLTAMLSTSCGSQPDAPVVVDGVADLRARRWAESGPVALMGHYRFYWKQFVDPGKSEPVLPKAQYLYVPGRWNQLQTDQGPAGARGYGTYALRILVDKAAGPYALRMQHVDSSYRMYVNGVLVSSCGRTGVVEEETSQGRTPATILLPSGADAYDVVLHISNFQHSHGGMPRPLLLGPPQSIDAIRINAVVLEVFLCGSILMMALYHLSLFALRRQDRSPLHFGLFCLLIALRTAMVGERSLLPYLGLDGFFNIAHKLEYLSFYLAAPAFYAYTRSVFPSPLFPRYAMAAIAAVFVAGSLVVAGAKPFVYSHTLLTFEVMAVAVGLNVLFGVIRSAYKRESGALPFLGGFALLFAGLLNDILYSQLIIHSGFFISFALFLFIFTQAFLLSRRSAAAYARSETLSADLANSEKRYRHLVEDSGEIILSLDDDGRILTANGATMKVLGYAPQQMVGRPLVDYLHTRRDADTFMTRHIFAQRLRDVYFEKRAQEFPSQFKTAWGDACELVVRIQRIHLATDNVIFAHLVQRPADHLARFIVEDRREYVIENNFNLAEMLNYSLTAGLESRMSEEDVMLARLGLREMIINAIEHGNLGITFQEKSAATNEGNLPALLQERLNEPRYADRKLHLRIDKDDDGVTFTIRDEGEGFDHRAMLARAERQKAEADDLLHGRGIAMTQLFFDQIIYNEAGNMVKLVKTFRGRRPGA